MNRIIIAALTACTLSAPAQSATSPEMASLLQNAIKNALVVVRQDYQLVDEEEDEIKNAPGKEYWGRTYSMGARVADNRFLISGDAVRPWSKDNLSKNDRFQPTVSHSAVRELEAPEFEPIDYSADDAGEIVENRLYTIEGSEITGMTLWGLTGAVKGYAVWATPSSAITETADNQPLTCDFTPMSLNIVDGKNIYDLPAQPSRCAFGGYLLVPVIIRPGAVDFCIVGQFMKIGGIWKLVTATEGTHLTPSTAMADPCMLKETIDGIGSGMTELISQIGF